MALHSFQHTHKNTPTYNLERILRVRTRTHTRDCVTSRVSHRNRSIGTRGLRWEDGNGITRGEKGSRPGWRNTTHGPGAWGSRERAPVTKGRGLETCGTRRGVLATLLSGSEVMWVGELSSGTSGHGQGTVNTRGPSETEENKTEPIRIENPYPCLSLEYIKRYQRFQITENKTNKNQTAST